jgi:hypothetical protein
MTKENLTEVFPKTFRITKCESGRADCYFEYSDNNKKHWFTICLHGAITLHGHFTELGYAELEPKVKFPSWHIDRRESLKNTSDH